MSLCNCDFVIYSHRKGHYSVLTWRILDSKTGETLTRASSVCVMMNKHTRKLSKMPDECREEIRTFFIYTPPFIDDDGRKLPKLEDNTTKYIIGGFNCKSVATKC